MNLFSPLCRGPAGDIKAKMLSCVSGLSMYCTSGVFFKQKSKKKFASSQAEKSGYNKKKLKLDFFWSCTGIFFQYKNIHRNKAECKFSLVFLASSGFSRFGV